MDTDDDVDLLNFFPCAEDIPSLRANQASQPRKPPSEPLECFSPPEDCLGNPGVEARLNESHQTGSQKPESGNPAGFQTPQTQWLQGAADEQLATLQGTLQRFLQQLELSQTRHFSKLTEELLKKLSNCSGRSPPRTPKAYGPTAPIAHPDRALSSPSSGSNTPSPRPRCDISPRRTDSDSNSPSPRHQCAEPASPGISRRIVVQPANEVPSIPKVTSPTVPLPGASSRHSVPSQLPGEVESGGGETMVLPFDAVIPEAAPVQRLNVRFAASPYTSSNGNGAAPLDAASEDGDSPDHVPMRSSLRKVTEMTEPPESPHHLHDVADNDEQSMDMDCIASQTLSGSSDAVDNHRGSVPAMLLSQVRQTVSAMVGTVAPSQHKAEEKRRKERIRLRGGTTCNFDRKAQSIRELSSLFDTPLYRFVHGIAFKTTVSVIIVMNTISIGLNMDIRLNPAAWGVSPGSWNTAMDVMEDAFGIFFLCELSLRCLAERWLFVLGEDKLWNLFDSLLVTQWLTYRMVKITVGSEETEGSSFSVLRTLRIIRFSRLLRIIRVMQWFRSFRVMVASILQSITSLTWVLLMLLFLLYFFAVVFLDGMAAKISELRVQDPSGDETHALLEFYGSLLRCVLSLFMAISGGDDWRVLMKPLMEEHWSYGFLFVMYVFFMVFGILNVITSVFVETATEVARQDKESMVLTQIKRQEVYYKNVKTFFEQADEDRSGLLSWAEFEGHLQDERVQAYFRSLELDVTQARALFMLLDLDDSDEVSIDEFVDGCLRLKGEAKSIDVNMLLYENERMIGKHIEFMERTNAQLEALADSLGALSKVQQADADAKKQNHSRRQSVVRALYQHPAGAGGTTGSRLSTRLERNAELMKFASRDFKDERNPMTDSSPTH
eukprot:TRINITY_DN11392_c0_g1_i1.p1 TRINITY_DN11392_c0_g1~~TRINITY_DN11392_c0_g1_i1.p1  ORF type:complete len:891 (+),score=183.28 TRINITY_DN11392_c0_g1_i1:97-2769(+)